MKRIINLTDTVLVDLAVKYMKYLQTHLNLNKTILMDETVVYFEHARTQTFDLRGYVVKSTSFVSVQITAVMSIFANGKKALALIIHKG